MARQGPGWAAFLYGLGARLFHTAYDRGWRKPARLPVPVLSVGNLTVGGTGKTPVVLEIARAARAEGMSPAILTRGYRSEGPGGVLRGGAWEEGNRATAAEAGDEPLLLSRRLPEIPVVVGRNRAQGAERLLAAGAPVDLFLLDDGFQHRALHRELDLVLLDAARPLGNERLLPRGPLRERPAGLGRARHLLFVGRKGEDLPPAARKVHRKYAPGAALSRGWVAFEGVSELSGNPCDVPSGEVWAVAGIAGPDRFARLLASSGFRVSRRHWFRDHHPFTAAEVHALESEAEAEDVLLVTTSKDAVRLEGKATSPRWRVMHIRVEVEGGWESWFSTHRPSRV